MILLYDIVLPFHRDRSNQLGSDLLTLLLGRVLVKDDNDNVNMLLINGKNGAAGLALMYLTSPTLHVHITTLYDESEKDGVEVTKHNWYREMISQWMDEKMVYIFLSHAIVLCQAGVCGGHRT